MVDSPGDGRKRQALGRGLGALIPGAEARRELFYCALDEIETGHEQPRVVMNPEGLSELAESIRQSGMLQPVLVRRLEKGGYQLIAGERRVRAARMAGLDRVPVLVKQVESGDVFALALIENIQREDLTALEEAQAYKRLMDDHGYTQKDLADRLGKGRSTIANAIRLLDLPEPVQDFVSSGRLTAGHARAVLSLPPEERVSFAQKVLDEGLSVRQSEERARFPEPAPEPRSTSKRRAPAVDVSDERQANLTHLEKLLREALQTRVQILDRRNGGKVEIYYDDDESLNAIVDRFLEYQR